MLDFERRGCDLRYTIIISFESSNGTGTGEANGLLRAYLKPMYMVDDSNLFSYLFALWMNYNMRMRWQLR